MERPRGKPRAVQPHINHERTPGAGRRSGPAQTRGRSLAEQAGCVPRRQVEEHRIALKIALALRGDPITAARSALDRGHALPEVYPAAMAADRIDQCLGDHADAPGYVAHASTGHIECGCTVERVCGLGRCLRRYQELAVDIEAEGRRDVP